MFGAFWTTSDCRHKRILWSQVMSGLFESPVKIITNDIRNYFPVIEGKCQSSVKKKKTSRNELRSASEKRPKSVPKDRKSLAKRKLTLFDASEQLALDFGQKDFDSKRCKTCNMLYTTGEVVDERTHEEYHDMFVNSLRFIGWKHEEVVSVYDDGRIIRIVADSKHKYMFKKVNELFKVADIELGINVDLESSLKPTSVYLLFATKTKRIAGFVASERIKSANKLISEEPFIASTDEVPAECGIARIWTHPNFRRQKIATRLLDTLRTCFSYGKIIPKSNIAFSDPTINGKDFAKHYTKRNNFLVYC
ncbi:N-acetyltransferase ESCO2-like, partial [Oppia nitens]|uniref:N-acetyltransferase ESCO2-like n=1 Tax=Oppia nitens TaxID=1686743 RepID=UPI0023DAA1C0